VPKLWLEPANINNFSKNKKIKIIYLFLIYFLYLKKFQSRWALSHTFGAEAMAGGACQL
jgi:hypothetical protein